MAAGLSSSVLSAGRRPGLSNSRRTSRAEPRRWSRRGPHKKHRRVHVDLTGAVRRWSSRLGEESGLRLWGASQRHPSAGPRASAHDRAGRTRRTATRSRSRSLREAPPNRDRDGVRGGRVRSGSANQQQTRHEDRAMAGAERSQSHGVRAYLRQLNAPAFGRQGVVSDSPRLRRGRAQLRRDESGDLQQMRRVCRVIAIREDPRRRSRKYAAAAAVVKRRSFAWMGNGGVSTPATERGCDRLGSLGVGAGPR